MRAFPRLQVFALSAALLGSGAGFMPLLAAPPTAIEVARQLNEAFVDVAQRGTASVVVVQVSQKLETLAGKSDHLSVAFAGITRRHRRKCWSQVMPDASVQRGARCFLFVKT